jgi:putative SOS response-associated peptidase YedK
MPMILKPDAWPMWLGEQPADVRQLKALLAPCPSNEMICWPVSIASAMSKTTTRASSSRRLRCNFAHELTTALQAGNRFRRTGV